jgi:hypothetical protein
MTDREEKVIDLLSQVQQRPQSDWRDGLIAYLLEELRTAKLCGKCGLPKREQRNKTTTYLGE